MKLESPSQQREKIPDDYSVVDPEHKLIYRFIRTLFSSAQLTAECAIVTLVSTYILISICKIKDFAVWDSGIPIWMICLFPGVP